MRVGGESVCGDPGHIFVCCGKSSDTFFLEGGVLSSEAPEEVLGCS